MDGPYFPGFGFHALIVLAFAVFWIVVVGGLFVALYFVIRTAVTRGIVRADALRARAAPASHERPVPPAQADDPRSDGPRSDPPRSDAPRSDPPPEVAA